jgi:hypothetical protein
VIQENRLNAEDAPSVLAAIREVPVYEPIAASNLPKVVVVPLVAYECSLAVGAEIPIPKIGRAHV